VVVVPAALLPVREDLVGVLDLLEAGRGAVRVVLVLVLRGEGGEKKKRLKKRLKKRSCESKKRGRPAIDRSRLVFSLSLSRFQLFPPSSLLQSSPGCHLRAALR